jgi:hypothetical protein
MSCTIVSNNISAPEVRDAVSKTVRDGIGQRLGEWKVVVYQPPDYPAFAIRIEGPKGLRWSWTFFEQEQDSAFIQQRVATGIIARLASQERSTEPSDLPVRNAGSGA